MRSENEIENALHRLQNFDSMDLRDDSFQFGMLVGKAIALGWVLGDSSADMSIQYDFEGWLAESPDLKSKITPPDEA